MALPRMYPDPGKRGVKKLIDPAWVILNIVDPLVGV
jgi:hypothetical protein